MPIQSCGQSVGARRGKRYTEIGLLDPTTTRFMHVSPPPYVRDMPTSRAWLIYHATSSTRNFYPSNEMSPYDTGVKALVPRHTQKRLSRLSLASYDVVGNMCSALPASGRFGSISANVRLFIELRRGPGRYRSPHRKIPSNSCTETGFKTRDDDRAPSSGLGRYCSRWPRHRMTLYSGNEGSQCVFVADVSGNVCLVLPEAVALHLPLFLPTQSAD